MSLEVGDYEKLFTWGFEFEVLEVDDGVDREEHGYLYLQRKLCLLVQLLPEQEVLQLLPVARHLPNNLEYRPEVAEVQRVVLAHPDCSLEFPSIGLSNLRCLR